MAALLRACELPSDDLTPDDLAVFDIVELEGRLLGTVALETVGKDGWLRSLAVQPDARHQGLGKMLVSQAEARARAAGVTHIYLLTSTAKDFFAKLGYHSISRSDAPEGIRANRQMTASCCACAAFMTKHVEPNP